MPPCSAFVVKKGSKMCESWSGAIPGPLSLTDTITDAPSGATLTLTSIVDTI